MASPITTPRWRMDWRTRLVSMRVAARSLARFVTHGDPGAELLGQELLGATDDHRVAGRERALDHPATGRRMIGYDPYPFEPAEPTRAIGPREPFPLNHGGIGHERPARCSGRARRVG